MNLLADAGSIHAGFTLPGAVAFQSNVAIHCANFKPLQLFTTFPQLLLKTKRRRKA